MTRALSAPAARHLLGRLAATVAMLLAVSALTFAVFYLLPSGIDPAVLRAGRDPTPARVAAARAALGLNHSVLEQFAIYLRHLVLHGDLGRSYTYDAPVGRLILARLPATAALVLGGALLWVTGAIAVGAGAAARRGRAFDRAAMGTALVLVSAPIYWLGLVALALFASDVGRFALLPGYASYPSHPLSHPGAWLGSLVLPWLVMAASFGAVYARLVRAGVLDALGSEPVRTARAMGISERRVVLGHALPLALGPVIALLGVDVGLLLGGAVLTETVFGIPGVGGLAVDAIHRSDLPVIQGTVLMGAVLVVAGNALADLALGRLDPRLGRP